MSSEPICPYCLGTGAVGSYKTCEYSVSTRRSCRQCKGTGRRAEKCCNCGKHRPVAERGSWSGEPYCEACSPNRWKVQPSDIEGARDE